MSYFQGDYGGPLFCNTTGQWELAGIASWGRSDCGFDYPVVSTRISKYLDWIKSVTGIN